MSMKSTLMNFCEGQWINLNLKGGTNNGGRSYQDNILELLGLN